MTAVEESPLLADSAVSKVYDQLRSMAISYAFKPGERLNEVALAKQLGVSRTPLREALNRLSIERLLRFLPGKGFFCRDLDVQEVFDLYELRKSIEVSAVRLAVARARDEDIAALRTFLDATGPQADGRPALDLVGLDETFHERLMAMSGNAEMLRILRLTNARIRFVRWIDMGQADRPASQQEHHAVLDALALRDEATCIAVLEKHIDRRLDRITAAIRLGFAHIYAPPAKGNQAGSHN